MAMRSALLVGLLGKAAVIAIDTVQKDGQCSADSEAAGCAASALAGDHQLLQVGGGKLQLTHKGQAEQTVPGQLNCEDMVEDNDDVEKVCSTNKCKVLATNMQHRTCNDFCAANGRTCVNAAEEVDETCDEMESASCGQEYNGGWTSDLLCECSTQRSVSQGSVSGSLTDSSALTLVWSDEFDGDHVDSNKWSLHHGGGGFGNGELQYYRPQSAQVANGILTITAKCDERHGFTSGKMQTKYKGDWGPGHRVEVRARVPKGKGTWPAIWMLPTDNSYGGWPRSGEIDIMESVGCTARKIYGTVHTDAFNHMKHTEKSNSVQASVDAWHTYTIDWTEKQIAWYLDGRLFHTFHPKSYEYQKWPYNRKFYLILNVAVGGSWGGMCVRNRPSCHNADEFGQPQMMEVDYARVYKL